MLATPHSLRECKIGYACLLSPFICLLIPFPLTLIREGSNSNAVLFQVRTRSLPRHSNGEAVLRPRLHSACFWSHSKSMSTRIHQ